jgi:radical SAM superfamily enzyme
MVRKHEEEIFSEVLNIPERLLLTFLETKKWTEAKVLTYAQKEPNLYTRVSKLISIYNDRVVKVANFQPLRKF